MGHSLVLGHVTSCERRMKIELSSLKNYESYEGSEHDGVERLVTR